MTDAGPLYRLMLLAGLVLASPAFGKASIAQYDAPKYPENFTHFDYADPGAPNDGDMIFQNYDAAQSYDSMNPFLIRGAPAPDLKNLMFDTLMQRSWDELASQYALIADDVEVAADGKSATFHINPGARFSNGDPITAADVKYSLDTLLSPKVSPIFNSQFANISSATVVDKLSVRFDFKEARRDAPLIAGDLPVFSPKWGMKADGTRPPFDQIANVPPIASGPYLIEQRKNDKQITYTRNPDYWAADLPSRRGMYRFKRITFRLFADAYSSREDFKAGRVDMRVEYSSSSWARKYVGKNFNNGTLRKEAFPNGPARMQGLIFNMRKPQFADRRVRQALTMAFDYDWLNRLYFYNQYRRTGSYFQDSPFGATGLPDAKQLALLEPYRSSLPPAVFGPMIQPPNTLPPNSLRGNLRAAQALLNEAGWHYRDGALRNAAGTPMTIEIIDNQPGMDGIIMPYVRQLQTLGIQARMRELDSALFEKRVSTFDYDMITHIYDPVTIPGNELTRRFGSAAASETGSENYPGAKSKAVDAMIDAALKAQTLGELETATRALDRVMINDYYLVPEYYAPNSRVGYRSRMGHPEVIPRSYGTEDWLISYWFVKPNSAQFTSTQAP
jgi:microcin C transport system substrate-binding protein